MIKELTLTTCPGCGKVQITNLDDRLKTCENETCKIYYDHELFSKVIKMDDFVFEALTTITGG